MNAGQVILGLALLFAAGKVFTGAKNFAQDLAADHLPGSYIFGIRSVAGKEAAEWIKSRLWLRKEYRDWIWSKFFSAVARGQYSVVRLGDQTAADIAKDIIRANTVIFGEGALDKLISRGLAAVGSSHADQPEMVVLAIKRIKNQVQALEVVEWYFVETYEVLGKGKNLSVGLQWLPDEYMIQVADYLKSLPTGAYRNGKQLSKLPTS